jgi:tRNA threonylcarbamoyladenosine modification (KEOPS) complex Cgi121 subunit
MEILLYASAQHQIKRATEIIGIKPKSRRIAMIVITDKVAIAEQALSAISEQVNAQRDESVLELQTHKVAMIRKTFGIIDNELSAIETRSQPQEALTDLVIERMALLSTKH